MMGSINLAAPAPTKKPMTKGDRHMSEDSVVLKEALATHSTDCHEVATRPLLNLVKDILDRATPTQTTTSLEKVEDKDFHVEVAAMHEDLAGIIHKISCEMACKCSGGGDLKATTLGLLKSLANYAWDSKVVIALAAFAVSYGEFWLTAHVHNVIPLAKSVAVLKQLPILEHRDALKPQFDQLSNLIKEMLDVTKSIVEFKELPSVNISQDIPEMAKALSYYCFLNNSASDYFPFAVYWIIRSVVACAAKIVALTGPGHEYIISTTEGCDLPSLALRLRDINGHLTKLLKQCIEAHWSLVYPFDPAHPESWFKDDLPFVKGSTTDRVSAKVLVGKIVMLFISDLDITDEELQVLTQIYNDTNQGKADSQYEIVWLPIVPCGSDNEKTFNSLAAKMPWYTPHHPSLFQPAAIKHIRDVWHFDKKPMLVVLDAQGKVVCPNAIHMVRIWGSRAPFFTSKEEDLWKNEKTLRLEFLVDGIDQMMVEWVRNDRIICLYGGEDIEWIEELTKELKKANVPLEMMYVGKRDARKRVKKAMEVIERKKLSGYWQDPVMVRFWVRLESMWYSMMQAGLSFIDPIVQEVMTMLSFDGGDEGWAVISRRTEGMVTANGNKMVDCLKNFETWKEKVGNVGFVKALKTELDSLPKREHCIRLILPRDADDRIQDQVACVECSIPMEKLVLYRCCKPATTEPTRL